MNWVGGSRNRLVVKNDAKKQREFFEKRKMQQKLKNLGVALPASPRGSNSSSGSMDLVTLFIVNQIAAKKDIKDPPKVAVLGSCKGGSKHKRNEPLVLPMSPCSPSQLSLVEGQPQHSVQGVRKRKHIIPQGFKSRQLSPVLESAFSDNSASDYVPPITDTVSPFSISSASSGQGIFPMQLNLQQRSQTQLPPHCSPPPWDTSQLDHTNPSSMTGTFSWSHGSNPPPYQLETPTAAQVLFRSPEPDNTETRDRARHEVTISLNQPEDKKPVLDFTLNKSETEQQFEGHVFWGFSTEECDREASHFGRGTSKICLKDEATSSAPQTVPEPQSMEVERSDHVHDPSCCTDMLFSCLEHNNGPMNGCEYSPSYSCGRGYVSLDSHDDEECCQPCLQVASSYMDRACCADSLNPNLGNTRQRHTKPRPPTPLLKGKMNVRDEQEAMENVAFQVKASGGNSQRTGSNTAQTQSSESCKCKKPSNEIRDAGTQTVNNPAVKMHDVSTQCSDIIDSASRFNVCLPPVDVSIQLTATGRQADPAAEPSEHTPSPGQEGRGDKNKSISSIINKHTDSRVIPQRPINPFHALRTTDGRGKENREGRGERGQQKNGHLMKDLSNEAREKVTTAIGLSEETETLQEIADILLLLKQRKEGRKADR